jgi:hypothetical protein
MREEGGHGIGIVTLSPPTGAVPQNGQLGRRRRFRAISWAVLGAGSAAICSGSPMRKRCGTASTKGHSVL